MEDTLRTFTPEDVKSSYRAALATGKKKAADAFMRAIEDPVEPISQTGKRRFHPVLTTLLFALVFAILAFAYFTLHRTA